MCRERLSGPAPGSVGNIQEVNRVTEQGSSLAEDGVDLLGHRSFPRVACQEHVAARARVVCSAQVCVPGCGAVTAAVGGFRELQGALGLGRPRAAPAVWVAIPYLADGFKDLCDVGAAVDRRT